MKKNPTQSIIKAFISVGIFEITAVIDAVLLLFYQYYPTDFVRTILIADSGLVLVTSAAIHKYVGEMLATGWKPDFHI